MWSAHIGPCFKEDHGWSNRWNTSTPTQNHTEPAGRRPRLSLELDVVSHLMWALGTEPRSSVRAVSSLSH